ncbi:histone deacetylase [bacterium]|nr:histone deacetylase [candidate division CSSED10-310 bacterium]
MNPPVVYHPEYAFDIGAHVFPTAKYKLILDTLKQLVGDLEVHVPEPARDDQILSVHDRDFVGDLRSYRHTRRTFPSELPISREIVDGFYLMAGGSCLAASLAMERGAAMNIGGGFHHAFADHAEGFCYINDVAVAVRDVLNRFDTLRKVAVVDTDLHQGNGTARIFQNDDGVFTFSIHQENNYPVKERSDLDIGLSNFVGDDQYLTELNRGLDTVFTVFKPDFAMYVAGVDPYENDQLGALKLTQKGMRERDSRVFERCARGKIPVAVLLAGGYAATLAETVALHVNTYLAMREIFGTENPVEE